MLKGLRRFNLTMGLFHFVQGSFMLYVALTFDKFKNFEAPVLTYFLQFNKELKVLLPVTETAFKLPFGVMVAGFLFISAFFHFLIAAPKINDVYNRQINNHMNMFRWYEYSISSSLMIVLIAYLFGVYELGALMLIFFINMMMNLFGLLMEKLNQYTNKTDWTPFVYGSIAGLIPWIVVVMYAFGNADPAEVPWFVYAIFGSYFFFFNIFPINMILQYKKVGPWKNYIYGERVYIILSLVAKSVLAWLVFAGLMQPK